MSKKELSYGEKKLRAWQFEDAYGASNMKAVYNRYGKNIDKIKKTNLTNQQKIERRLHNDILSYARINGRQTIKILAIELKTSAESITKVVRTNNLWECIEKEAPKPEITVNDIIENQETLVWYMNNYQSLPKLAAKFNFSYANVKTFTKFWDNKNDRLRPTKEEYYRYKACMVAKIQDLRVQGFDIDDICHYTKITNKEYLELTAFERNLKNTKPKTLQDS
jgi:hypothetical protein